MEVVVLLAALALCQRLGLGQAYIMLTSMSLVQAFANR
jgi:hypothetical protein